MRVTIVSACLLLLWLASLQCVIPQSADEFTMLPLDTLHSESDIDSLSLAFADLERHVIPRELAAYSNSLELQLKFSRHVSAHFLWPLQVPSWSSGPPYPVVMVGYDASTSVDYLTHHIAAQGFFTVAVPLANKVDENDYAEDMLFLLTQMTAENVTDESPLHELVGTDVSFVGFDEGAKHILMLVAHDVFYPNYNVSEYRFVSWVVNSVDVRESTVTQAFQHLTPGEHSIMFLTGSTDCERAPALHTLPLFGLSQTHLCRWYVSLNGGNHCAWVDSTDAYYTCAADELRCGARPYMPQTVQRSILRSLTTTFLNNTLHEDVAFAAGAVTGNIGWNALNETIHRLQYSDQIFDDDDREDTYSPYETDRALDRTLGYVAPFVDCIRDGAEYLSLRRIVNGTG